MTMRIAATRIFLDADKAKALPEGHADAAFLYAAPGDEIPDESVKRFGLEKATCADRAEFDDLVLRMAQDARDDEAEAEAEAAAEADAAAVEAAEKAIAEKQAKGAAADKEAKAASGDKQAASGENKALRDAAGAAPQDERK